MAILKDSDIFPFDEYSARLKGLETDTAQFAQSTVQWLSRIKATGEEAAHELQQIYQDVQKVSTGNVDKATASFRAYEQQIEQAGRSLDTSRQAQKTLTDAQQLNAQVVADLTAKLATLHQRYQALDPTQKSYAKEQKAILSETTAVTRAIDLQGRSLKQAKVATDAAEGSYQKLSQQTNELRAQLRGMPGAFDLTTGAINRQNKAAVEMHDIIVRNDRALKTADASMGNHQRNVGNYGSALKGLGSQALMVSGQVLGISTAFEAITATIGVISDMERLDAGLKAVSRDTDDFRRSQQFLLTTSDELGLRYDGLVKTFKLLKAATKDTSLEGAETEHIFHALAEAGARLQLTGPEVEGALYAITQMISKSHVTAEELRQQLGERLPGAMKIMAAATGVSERELDKMMQKGDLLAVEVLPKFAKQLDKIYGGDAQGAINTMSAGWNRMTNEAQQFIAAFNENKKVSTFFGSISTGIAGVLRDMGTLVKSNEWGLFMQMFTGNAGLSMTAAAGIRSIQAKAAKQESDFRALPAEQRAQAVLDAQDKKIRLEMQLNALVKQSPTEENTKRELVLQQELNKAKARYNFLNKVANDQAKADTQILNAKEREKADADKAKKEKDDKAKTAADRKAEAAANKALSDALSKSKAGTDVQLSDLGADKQDGLISEQTFIDKRKVITLAGIAERQTLLANAHKQETDDYKRLAKEKIDAETAYKRDSLKLALSDSKSTTTTALSGLATQKADGSVSEADYVEQKLQITIGGLRDQQRILTEAGQVESKLYRDTEQQILDETAAYYRDRLKVQQSAWKTELEQTKTALDEVDRTLGESYRADLLALDNYYNEKERKLQVDTAKGKLSPQEGEAQLFALKMERLTAELNLTESTYQKDIALSKAVFDQKIADLEAYKADAMRTPQEIAEAEKQLIKLKQAREKEAADDKKKLDTEVARNGKEKSDEQTKHEIDNATKAVKKREELLQLSLQLAGTIGDATFSILSSGVERESQQLDKQHENELRLAGDNVDAKTRIEEQYAKRKAELARKAAIAEREQALFSIAINTAMGVASVLSTGGGTRYADFGISAGILSAFVIAGGIAQAAAVLAKPLPAYAKGKLETDTYAGPALAGEAGTELLVDREGYGRLFDKPTVFNTQPGDRVYNASETADILAETGGYTQTATRLREGKLNEQIIIQQRAGASGSALSKKDVHDAFASALDNRPADVTIYDAEGVKRGRKQGQSYTEYVEKRTKW